jgi:hypothetical protein
MNIELTGTISLSLSWMNVALLQWRVTCGSLST